MDTPQADFFKANVLPIIREAGENRESPSAEQYNPLRPMLRMLLVYIDYLDAAGANQEKQTEARA